MKAPSIKKPLIQSFLVSVATQTIGLLNYGFQVSLAILLSPKDLTTVAATVASVMLVSAPLRQLFLPVSGLLAKKDGVLASEADKRQLTLLISTALIYLSVVLLVMSIFSDSLESWLKLNSQTEVMQVSFAVAVSATCGLVVAVLQGYQYFNTFNITGISIASLKLILIWILSFLALNHLAIINIIYLTMGFVFFIAAISIRHEIFEILNSINWHYNSKNSREIFKNFKFMLIGSSIVFLSQYDVALVNYFFPVLESSTYVKAMIIGKILLYIPGGLGFVLVPYLSRSSDSGRLLARFTVCFLFIFGIVSGCLAFYLDDSLGLLFADSSLSNVVDVLGFAILAMTPLSIVVFLETLALSKGEVIYSNYSCAGCFLMVAAASTLQSLVEVYYCFIMINFLIFMAGISSAVKHRII